MGSLRPLGQRGVDGLGHKLFAGAEVPVEPAVGEPGLVHHLSQADVVDPVAPDAT